MDRPPRDDGYATDATYATNEPFQQCHESGVSSGIPLIPREGFFEGQVAILGRTRVEGTVRGSLRGPGELVLGPEARVEGFVECDVLSCRGVIVGPVIARVRAHFGDGAHFEGDLESPTVKIDGDAVWIGVAHVGG